LFLDSKLLYLNSLLGKENTLPIFEKKRSEAIFDGFVHDGAVPVAPYMSINALQRIAPNGFANHVARYTPSAEANEVCSEHLSVFRCRNGIESVGSTYPLFDQKVLDPTNRLTEDDDCPNLTLNTPSPAAQGNRKRRAQSHQPRRGRRCRAGYRSRRRASNSRYS